MIQQQHLLLPLGMIEAVVRCFTGERIRDKIAAAKRKGMWMGGVPPLGYDVDNRLLVINESEAAVVRRIFEEMLTIGSPTQIAANLTAEGITTKAWTTQEGQTRSGARIDKKYLHKLLRNRIYLGELSHKGSWYPGAHPPIIDSALWEKVHSVLARDSHARSVETKIRSRTDALLRGLMDDSLETFVPLTFRRRGSRRVAADDRDVHDVTLLEGIARGFYWQQLVDTGAMKSGSDIARAEGLHPSVPNELMRLTLTLLAPEVLERLTESPTAVLEHVMRQPWPNGWSDQMRVLAPPACPLGHEPQNTPTLAHPKCGA